MLIILQVCKRSQRNSTPVHSCMHHVTLKDQLLYNNDLLNNDKTMAINERDHPFDHVLLL